MKRLKSLNLVLTSLAAHIIWIQVFDVTVNDVRNRLRLFFSFYILLTCSICNLHALFLGELIVAYMEANTFRHLFYNYS